MNVFDLVAIAAGGRSGSGREATWSQGDFDYDGLATTFDLIAIGQLAFAALAAEAVDQ